ARRQPLDVPDETARAVHALLVLVERVDEARPSPAGAVQIETGERDVVGEREVAVETTGDFLRVLGPRDLEILEFPERRDAFPVLRAYPLHGAAQEVREKQAVDQHGLGPWDRLLIPGHEPGTGREQELPGRVGRDEVAGAENVADAWAGAAVLDQVLEMDDLLPEPHQLTTLSV